MSKAYDCCTQWCSGRCRCDHDLAHEHSNRVQGREDWIRFREKRTRYGGGQQLLPATSDWVSSEVALHGRCNTADLKNSTSKALHLCTTGSIYPASHPLLSDLFTETLPTPDAVLPRALELADEIVKNCSGVSLHLIKEMMYRGPGSPEATHLLDSRIVYELFTSKDNKEGVKAFLEKRQTNFTGTMQNDAPAAWPWWEPIAVGNKPVQKGYKFKPSL